MPKTGKILSVFLASPGDVNDERGQVDAFIVEWNNLWSEELGVRLHLVRWETHAYPSVGADGQDVINTQIGDDYDVFIGIMWKRFGTPTGRASSGTVEELERALKRNRSSGSPQVMFYFKKVISEIGDDETQLRSVQQFRAKLAHDGLLYWEFLNSTQFGQLVRVHLTRHVQNWAKRYNPRPDAVLTKTDLEDRFNDYLQTIKKRSAILNEITRDFAKTHIAFTSENSRRAARTRAMSDDELTTDFMKLDLIEMAKSMEHYADASVNFEANFIQEFSFFVEAVLGAAAISIAFPAAHTKSLSNTLLKLRQNLHPVYGTMAAFIDQRAKVKPRLSGVMVISNERIIAALGKFREHVRFGEKLLIESEKLFNKRR